MSRILTGILIVLLLSSCGAVSMTGTENLLSAPTMNPRQAEVLKALALTLPLNDIVYQYPQSGDYRSPFVFFDLNGDSREEAVVFYSLSDESGAEARAKVLKQDDLGIWSSFYDITLQSGEVEWIEFHKLLSADSYCMMVGLKPSNPRDALMLQVYSMHENSFLLEAEHQYHSYTVRDFSGDGVSDVAIIARSALDRTFFLSLLQKQGDNLSAGPRISLSPEIEDVKMLTYGKLWDGASALFVDGLLANGLMPTIATEIIRADALGLSFLAGGDLDRGGEYNLARINYEFTFRDESVFSMDIDGNYTVEVPYPVSLPGVYSERSGQAPKLMQLMRLEEDGFMIYRSAVINADSGYLLLFPERWQDDSVTVEIRPDTSEWLFRKWDPEAQHPAEELLRIRVAARDSGGNFNRYAKLETKGMASYYAYIPRLAGEELAVTEQEVRELFRLLPY
ncbi:MAG: hypothetical protein FWG94_06325 [Oscillospiraceae bacterium]|nr:hypothetical protein [Oscillospiraceae bacterium]